nr:immunoglobulin heavy chain junction region [Macaca mulatta]MOX59023.1 immunoglobulin heavy chain junction region [Macaca mulatta]MOX59512.1 immunoglobulin heavy chain junction region [Macaca mulatta]MOX60778.1 immunoglobulin heavy chain junction region [Macaca mulatta]MOX61618.1 immunoglobulin heavy chain junction region [Macaca mulatta]
CATADYGNSLDFW